MNTKVLSLRKKGRHASSSSSSSGKQTKKQTMIIKAVSNSVRRQRLGRIHASRSQRRERWRPGLRFLTTPIVCIPIRLKIQELIVIKRVTTGRSVREVREPDHAGGGRKFAYWKVATITICFRDVHRSDHASFFGSSRWTHCHHNRLLQKNPSVYPDVSPEDGHHVYGLGSFRLRWVTKSLGRTRLFVVLFRVADEPVFKVRRYRQNRKDVQPERMLGVH